MVEIQVKDVEEANQRFLYECECSKLVARYVIEIYNLISKIHHLNFTFQEQQCLLLGCQEDVARSLMRALSEARAYASKGPRMVRDVFRLAKKYCPSIIFIDEVDDIDTARFDAQTGGDREVQRILMELLDQMDGFDQTVNVKVIMATNRADTLGPALLRPDRLDRKIEFPLPDRLDRKNEFPLPALLS